MCTRARGTHTVMCGSQKYTAIHFGFGLVLVRASCDTTNGISVAGGRIVSFSTRGLPAALFELVQPVPKVVQVDNHTPSVLRRARVRDA